MLSSVLRSKRAIQVNIAIMDTFVRLPQLLATNEELSRKIEKMEQTQGQVFQYIFGELRRLSKEQEEESGKRIGFRAGDRR